MPETILNNDIAANENLREKSLAGIETYINDVKTEYTISPDMISNGNDIRSLEPGILKFSVFDKGNYIHSSVGIHNYYRNDLKEIHPLEEFNLIEGIYNGHPFHMLIEKGEAFTSFADHFIKACKNGQGQDFLKKYQFAFYDDTPVADVDPQNIISFMVASEKIDMVEDESKDILNEEIAKDVSDLRKSLRKDLSANEQIIDVLCTSGPKIGNIDHDALYGFLPHTGLNLLNYVKKIQAPASKKQIDFIVNNIEKFSRSYQKYFQNLTDEQEKSLSFSVASDAIRGAVAREKLKNYLPKLDKRWKTMDTREAEILVFSFRNKPTLQQQNFLARYVPEADMEKLDFAKAKAVMGAAKATDKLKAMAAQFADIKNSASLTCTQAIKIIKSGVEKAKASVFEAAPAYIARHVSKFKDNVKDHIVEYTRAQWEKDCCTVPPFEAQKAFIEWHHLDEKIRDHSKSSLDKFPQNSCALYSKVMRDYVEYQDELKRSPATDIQLKYLKSKGVDDSYSCTYSEAHEAVVSTLYENGFVSKNIAKYLMQNPEIKLADEFLSEAASGKEYSQEEKKKFNQELKSVCVGYEKFRRTYEIHNSLNSPAYSLQDIARQVAADHYEKTKSFDGADKEIAKVLSCTDFNASDGSLHMKKVSQNIAERLGKSPRAVSRNEIIADTITRVLPQNINYKKSMENNLELVANAQKGLANEMTKARIKQEVKTKSKENFKKKAQSQEAAIG